MKASSTAMSSGWGQSCHGTNFKVGFWRTLYALITGKRLLYCESGIVLDDAEIPLEGKEQRYNLDDMHGVWSDDAGATIWKTAVTKAYVCQHPKCMAEAVKRDAQHIETYKDPESRKVLAGWEERNLPGIEYTKPF